ncbi:isoleucine--tRNA ligase [Patescibacteria group bacterium]
MPKKKPVFEPTTSRPDFVKLEKELLKWWEDNQVIEKYLKKNKHSKRNFSFMDGPITANNPMGVHHAWGRTLKDLFQRYKNMQGFRQRFQNGFDCQGLWVEVEVEKELKFNSKKDIEKFGVDKFTQACKDRVTKFADVQTEQSKRLGMFMDWENSYFTNSETNNLYIWHFLKIVHQKGWLYKDKSSATWCPRCETGLSQHEQADGYQDIVDNSVFVKFKLTGNKNEHLLVWTTTPWTLSANVLLAVNSEYNYVAVKKDKETWYLAEESAIRLGLNDFEKVAAKDLLGRKYHSLYDIPAQKDIEHKVVEWDLVDSSEGTGVVHVAPGCGQEDYELGKELGVAMISPLDPAGHFTKGFGDLSSKYAHEVAGQVIDYLKTEKVLYKTETIQHRYPHCWRCGTKCLFRLEDDWFIDCSKLKPVLKKRAEEASWLPKFAGKRMQNWLENMGDWMISRKRYYGLALPFYECRCGEVVVVGSKKELKKLAIDPKKVDQLPSLHRPWIDQILINCPKCSQEVKRIQDVGDCWLDAGVVPFSTLKYLEDKDYWQKWFPAKLICEMIEQIRLWYYSMLVYATVLENKVPYLNVLNFVEVRDEKGERMSKTKKTSIPFDEAVEKMGADAMRWLYCSQNPTLNLNFGFGIADEVRRRFHFLLNNVFHYFTTYANLDGWVPGKGLASVPTELDLWVLTRLDELIIKVSENLEAYQSHRATVLIEEFVQDLSTWWLRRSRERMGPTATDKKDKALAYSVLYLVLITLSKILAPFVPFLSEDLYLSLRRSKKQKDSLLESVHLVDWPQVVNKKAINSQLLSQMKLVRKICELGHSARQTARMKVRQPLASITCQVNEPRLSKQLNQIIKDELNVKKVIWIKKKVANPQVFLDTKITGKLAAEGETRELVRQIQILRKEKGYQLDEKIKVVLPKLPKDPQQLEYLKRKTLAEKVSSGKRLQLV